MSNLYTLSVPMLKTMLTNLAAILKKAEDHAAARKVVAPGRSRTTHSTARPDDNQVTVLATDTAIHVHQPPGGWQRTSRLP